MINLKYAPYSWSKINIHKFCPRKWKYTYIDKLPVETKSEALDKGKFIHLLLEYKGDLHKIRNHKDFKDIKSRVTPEQLKEYIKIYRDFTKTNTYRFIESKKDLFTELPIAMDKDLEIKDYNDPDIIFRGYIDRVVADEGKDILILIDWKTGKFKEAKEFGFGQLLFYGISLFSKLPFDKILLLNVFVEHNKINKQILKREDIERYKKALFENIKKVEQDKEFKKNETNFCPFCEYYKHCYNDPN